MMSGVSRRRELELLLATLEDYFGSSLDARVWAGYGRAQPGPAPSTRRPCRACDGVGRVIPSGRPCVACRDGRDPATHACRQCPDCAGEGLRWVDAYTEAPVSFEPLKPKHISGGTVKARSHAVRAVGLEEQAPRWETRRERAERAGSYRELRRALEWLGAADARGHRLVLSVHIRGVQRRLSGADAGRLEACMRVLEALMPDPMRLPQVLREQLSGEQRSARARELRAGGASLRAIQRDLGVRKPALRRLLGEA